MSIDSQIARLEVRVEHIERHIADIKTDVRCLRDAIEDLGRRSARGFRITWGSMIATNLGLGALMAKGFGWL